MHIHAFNTDAQPDMLIERFEKAGIYGGCVFSNWPDRSNPNIGTSFETRLDEAISWARGYEDRIFPIIWIHPYEENIMEKIKIACDAGIAGFKIICQDFYVYEKECIKVLEEISKYNRPVFFHSGILWDGEVSSEYNRPLNWEALLKIKNLRFSMGHCSWPWIDECIALYGKFLNARKYNVETAEMFFDITPGTPEIYRKELLEKLYTIGYDVSDNVFFGTDSVADDYKTKWAEKWLDTDRKILDEIGVSKENREKLYEENFKRFLGKDEMIREKTIPLTDDSGGWIWYNDEVKDIISKWYKKLSFSEEYDREFYSALNNYRISDALDIALYDKNEADGKRNLLSYLFMCEKLKEKYDKVGISEDVLYDTLSDLVIWTDIWSNIKDELYLGEIDWLSNHLSMKLFKLGRLQFCMAISECDISSRIQKGDKVIEIHIPEGSPLSEKECVSSIEAAKEFFKKHFPEFDYKAFICHSWLLDESLKKYLKKESNILKFQNMFDIVLKKKSDSVLKYVFSWNARRRNIKNFNAETSFSKEIKKAVCEGSEFYVGYGVLKNSV